MKSFLSFLLFMICSMSWAQQRMSSTELSYLYNEENEFLIRFQVASQGNDYKVYLNFMLNDGNVRITDYNLRYDIRESYITEKIIESGDPIDSTKVLDVAFREFTYLLEFEKQNNNNLLVVDIYNVVKDEHFYLDIPLSGETTKPTSYLIFEADKDIPYFSKYINRNYPIRIKSVFGESLNYKVSGIENNKPVSLPPFDESERTESTEVPIDTLYETNEDELFEFNNEGYHTIYTSDIPDSFIKILVADEFFPYFEDYKDLIQPLIYVSSNKEYTEMRDAEDTRLAFENYVNNTITANQVIAKDFVKFYYRRVRESARLFTEDRAGWKTDRGMIFQVYGDPAQVFRNEKTELWVYTSPIGGRIRFIFDIIYDKGIRQFKLIRGNRYREEWMQAVTQWRAGRIIE